MRARVLFLALGIVASCRATMELPERATGGAAGGATLANTPLEAGAGELPCDVARLLETRCATCHDANKTGAPTSLVTFADLALPSRTDPSKSAAQVSVDRVSAGTMPPTAPLASTELAVLADWVAAGLPGTGCSGEPLASRDASAPGCVLASDCPGDLICRNGACDVECASDKDCPLPTTCKETRCRVAKDASATVFPNELSTLSAWTAADVSPVSTVSYNGGTFDGRYVYFAPDGASGAVLRLDTKDAFGSLRSWASFDLAISDPIAKTYRGAVFDGRYAYFVPASGGARFARYDTRGLYLDPASWTLFDLTTIDPSVGFTGATFDGRYIYLVPTASRGMVFRYDTQAPFTQRSAWATFSMTSVKPLAYAFAGAVFDGKYVYFVPTGHADGPHGLLVRYDADAPFARAASWTTLDLAELNPAAVGFRTGAFDGRFLYLVPGWTAPTPTWSSRVVARFDTRAPFGAPSSWSFFDTTTAHPGASGYNAAVFDGRGVILAPGLGQAAYHGTMMRFDTLGTFETGSSWSAFDVEPDFLAKNLRAAISDGRYVYFAPSGGSALRFESSSARVELAAPSFY